MNSQNAWGGQTKDDFLTSLRRIVRIKKPDNFDSKKIRDTILLNEFGFTEPGVVDFNGKYPNTYVIEDTNAPNIWAARKKVEKWVVEADGLVPIVLEDPWVNAVVAFRNNRTEVDVIWTTGFVTDGKLREELRTILTNLLTSFGSKRIEALKQLMLSISGFGKNRQEIYRSLRTLTNEAGYKNNPFLLIAFAHTTNYQSGTTSVGVYQSDYLAISMALKSANERLYDPSLGGIAKLSREEAAEINLWGSKLYEVNNLQVDSIRRLWISRYFSLSDEDKKGIEPGNVIQFFNPNAEDQSNRSRNLSELDAAQRGDPIDPPPPSSGGALPKTDDKNEELFQKKSDRADFKDAVTIGKKRTPPPGKIISRESEL